MFACWQDVEHNPWHVRTALRAMLPPPPVPAPGKSPVGPFAFGDDEYVRELLEGAGFAAVESTPHETTVRAPASAVFDRALLQFMGVPPEREDEALGADRAPARAVRGGARRVRLPAGVPGVPGRQPLTPPVAGYSGTPLPKKLGITEGSTLALIGAPPGVIDGLPPGVTVKRQARGIGRRRGRLLHPAT